jgi:hypothetical protein
MPASRKAMKISVLGGNGVADDFTASLVRLLKLNLAKFPTVRMIRVLRLPNETDSWQVLISPPLCAADPEKK